MYSAKTITIKMDHLELSIPKQLYRQLEELSDYASLNVVEYMGGIIHASNSYPCLPEWDTYPEEVIALLRLYMHGLRVADQEYQILSKVSKLMKDV